MPLLNHWRDSRLLKLNSGFQSPGFRIPQAKISRTPNPDSLHEAKRMGATLTVFYGYETC